MGVGVKHVSLMLVEFVTEGHADGWRARTGGADRRDIGEVAVASEKLEGVSVGGTRVHPIAYLESVQLGEGGGRLSFVSRTNQDFGGGKLIGERLEVSAGEGKCSDGCMEFAVAIHGATLVSRDLHGVTTIVFVCK